VTSRWPIDRIRYKDGYITAGLDPYVLLGMVPILRKTSQDLPPIKLRPPCPACGTAEETDGRHRWTAYVMAGRPDVPYELDPPAEPRG
jgi:hypothetical protein